jgi:hypothetical protein
LFSAEIPAESCRFATLPTDVALIIGGLSRIEATLTKIFIDYRRGRDG